MSTTDCILCTCIYMWIPSSLLNVIHPLLETFIFKIIQIFRSALVTRELVLLCQVPLTIQTASVTRLFVWFIFCKVFYVAHKSQCNRGALVQRSLIEEKTSIGNHFSPPRSKLKLNANHSPSVHAEPFQAFVIFFMCWLLKWLRSILLNAVCLIPNNTGLYPPQFYMLHTVYSLGRKIFLFYVYKSAINATCSTATCCGHKNNQDSWQETFHQKPILPALKSTALSNYLSRNRNSSQVMKNTCQQTIPLCSHTKCN